MHFYHKIIRHFLRLLKTLYVSHQFYNTFHSKSTIGYNLGPKLSGSDVSQSFSLFLMVFDKINKKSNIKFARN